MPTSFLRHNKFAAAATVIALLAFLAGCTSRIEQTQAPAPGGPGVAQDKAFADLNNLAPPSEADAGIHSMLVDELRRQLSGLAPGRFVATVPTTEANAVSDLRVWDNGDGTAQCRFSYVNQGDYSQDSTVTVSDITPIAIYINAVAGDADWVKTSLADGDANGMVTVSDLTPIAIGFNNVVDGYYLQASDSVDGVWQDIATLPFEGSVLPEAGGKRQFVYTIAAPVLDNYYRVVPFFQSERGVAGIPFQYTAAPLPTFSVSGICTDGTGSPLAGIQVNLGNLPEVETGLDGSFEFTDVADGYSGLLTPNTPGLIFLPQIWIVQINNGAAGNIPFRGFEFGQVEAALPATVPIREPVTFGIEITDVAGQALVGFTWQAAISVSPPTAVVDTQPGFVNGVATASIHFIEPGEYTINLSGLHTEINGIIGTINITQSYTPVISIEKWQGGAEGALSLVFDDATADHWSKGMPLWEEYGFRVTLAILARRFQDEPSRLPQLQEAFDAGHELANHSTTHPYFTTLSDTMLREELDTCKQLIVDNVNGLEDVVSVVYPYEVFNSHVIDELEARGYLFARSGQQGINDHATANDAWNPPLLNLYSWANLNTLPIWMWDSIPERAVNSGDWMIEQCHGIGAVGEAGVGWSPVPLSDYRSHYDHIKTYGERLWVAPMGEVGLYLLERNSADIENLAVGGNQFEFNVSDGYDDERYYVPLTLTIDRPEGWQNITVRQGTTPLAVSEPTATQLRFNVTPGAGAVSVANGG